MRFIVDQTQTPNLKVKVAILRYIEALARQMDPADFVNSSETRLAVSRIITWTTEPKSSDVRKVGRQDGASAPPASSHGSVFVVVYLFVLSVFFCLLLHYFCRSSTHLNPQTLHNWAGEDFSGRPSTVASLPGEGNLEERCKQVETARAA